MRIMLDTNVLVSALLFPSKKFDFIMEHIFAEHDRGLFIIWDVKDYPVLYTAIIEDVDVLITGDKDFTTIKVEKPEIVTPTEFVERYSPTIIT